MHWKKPNPSLKATAVTVRPACLGKEGSSKLEQRGSEEGKQICTSFQAANPAQGHKHASCTISRFCSILYWPSRDLCCLFGKSRQKCFPVSMIWAMLKLCCYSKPSCSGNAPHGLVSSAGGRPTCNGLRCCDFSAASCCYSSACTDITGQPQQRKTQSQPNHRTVWDWQDFLTLLQLKHQYKVWEKFFSTEKTLIFWLDKITHYNSILNKLSWS